MFGETDRAVGRRGVAADRRAGPVLQLIELGPGRGTMMLDALRAARAVPEFRRALRVHLIEMSPALQQRQAQTLRGVHDVPVRWHATLDEVPPGPPSSSPTNSSTRCRSTRPSAARPAGTSGGSRSMPATNSPSRSPRAARRLRAQPAAAVAKAPIGAIFEWRADRFAIDLAARVRHGRRRAGGRLRPCRERSRRHLPGSAVPSLCEPAGDAGLDRPHRPCRFRGARPRRPRRRRPHSRAGRAGHAARSGSASRRARRACKVRSPRTSGPRIAAALTRLVGTGAGRHGHPVQGDGDLGAAGATAGFAPSAGLRPMTGRIEVPALAGLTGIRHAFFTRDGGVSGGVYASLNAGVGSNDAPDNVAENRARMAAALGVAPERFLTCYQIHSPDVVVADAPWSAEARPRADAIVTPAGPCDRRLDGGLRPGAVRRSGGAHHRRRACRLARRARRRDRRDHRRDGAARRHARAHRRGDRPDDPPAELRGRHRSEGPVHRRRSRQHAVLPAGRARRPFHVRSRRLCRRPACRRRRSGDRRTSAPAPMPMPSDSTATAA